MAQRPIFAGPRDVLVWCVLLGLGKYAWAEDAASPTTTATPSAEAATTTPSPAEGADKTGPAAGHSAHGEAFNDGPRQSAYLMGGTGRVHLAITTKAPLAQEFFDQGLGQLHGFWYYEAERSFRQAAALDPDCAMAYWGMAMANVNNQNRGRGLVAAAGQHRAGIARHEEMYIDALTAYYKAEGEEKARRRQYIRDLESIIHEFPNDIEAKALLALQIWLNSSHEYPINSHQAVDSLIGEVLAVEPMHPVHHYRVHLWDAEKPVRALKSAAVIGQSAPTIAHMWHMSGHIFSKLQRYDDAAWQQEASARVDHAHMIHDRILPDQIHNYAHNNEWLVRDLLFVGRVRDAIDLSRNLIELPRHPSYNQLGGGGSAQYGRTRLYDALVGYELWDELLATSQTPYLEPTEIFDEQVKRQRYIGVAWFGKGDPERAQAQITLLETLLATEKREQESAAATAEQQARANNQNDEQIQKARTDAIQARAPRLNTVEAALAELRGLAFLAARDFPAAFAQFDKSNRIESEFLSRAKLAAGDAAKAEELARQAVNNGRNQVYPLANLVDVLWRLGKQAEAVEAFNQLRPLSSRADLSMPVFQRIAPVAAHLGLPADWRPPAPTKEDVGVRPDLATLGPFRWHPSAAPDWTLPGPDGAPVSLGQYRGRPVVLLFYLGHGCVHCIEQLKTFGPLQPQFASAGIALMAISTDTVEELQSSLSIFPADQAYPFTLLSDDGLGVFRQYRAFDDFENKPLHATVLIDGDGLVRWHDIGHQPFSNADFLLKEAKRLLAIPGIGETIAPQPIAAASAAVE
jgi:peroxiredoxin